MYWEDILGFHSVIWCHENVSASYSIFILYDKNKLTNPRKTRICNILSGAPGNSRALLQLLSHCQTEYFPYNRYITACQIVTWPCLSLLWLLVRKRKKRRSHRLSSWAACGETNGLNHKGKPFGWIGGVLRVAEEQRKVCRGQKKEGVLGVGGVIMGLKEGGVCDRIKARMWPGLDVIWMWLHVWSWEEILSISSVLRLLVELK